MKMPVIAKTKKTPVGRNWKMAKAMRLSMEPAACLYESYRKEVSPRSISMVSDPMTMWMMKKSRGLAVEYIYISINR